MKKTGESEADDLVKGRTGCSTGCSTMDVLKEGAGGVRRFILFEGTDQGGIVEDP